MTRVRAIVIHAESQTATVPLRGRTENKRTVVVKAETGGKIVERAVERGQRVKSGQMLCRISARRPEAKFDEGKEAVNQAQNRIRGRTQARETGAHLRHDDGDDESAPRGCQAQLARAEIELAHTNVVAPFAGIVEDTQVEIGDFVQPGSACATVIDLDPMLLVGRVAERDVHKLKLGTIALGSFIDGTQVSGKLTFIGQQSDTATRTYPVEIQVPNPDLQIAQRRHDANRDPRRHRDGASHQSRTARARRRRPRRRSNARRATIASYSIW